PWRVDMGFHIRPHLIAAPLLLALPVHAQQTEAPGAGLPAPSTATPPAPSPNQQGPELDVFRDPVTPRATPPVIVVPTVTPPSATVQPTPQPSRPRTPSTPAPSSQRASPPAERPAQTPAPARQTPAPATERPETPAPAAAGVSDNAADNAAATPPSAALPTPGINAIPEPAREPAVAPASAPAADEDGLSLPWIIGGVVAIIILIAAAFILNRRQPAPARRAPRPAAAPTPMPAAPKAETPPAAGLVAARPTPAATPQTDRPWLDMDLGVTQARYSMMGVTINYALVLHNRGGRPARDVLVRGILGNGGAQQQAVLQGFFTGADGLPLHSAVSIAPGETIQLAGELRLSPDQIVPVDMGQRSLLIPLAAFDAGYRWDVEGADADGHIPDGQGRTARAFIVGQEQEPPVDRLAPLRLDQGPRQYRRPAARAAAELTPA
uniref:hypothetical protein n=1 Tax=Sphingobium sp. TaxID=1912891 RepID=UPI003B3ABAE4